MASLFKVRNATRNTIVSDLIHTNIVFVFHNIYFLSVKLHRVASFGLNVNDSSISNDCSGSKITSKF